MSKESPDTVPIIIGHSAGGAFTFPVIAKPSNHHKAVGYSLEFDGPHLLPAKDGWEEVADHALDWAVEHAVLPAGRVASA